MANSHAEDATGIAAAIRPLATRKELGESEQRLNAASEELRSNMLEEMKERDKRIRKELKADMEEAVERNRFFSPLFAETVQALITGAAIGLALVWMAMGLAEFIKRITGGTIT